MAPDEDLTADPYAARRHAMVERDIRRRGVNDAEVLEAMRRVPRHLFVPPEMRATAYSDRALPIGGRQTISQPYIVARMVELARVGPEDRVLDVGTGSGYAAAVLAEIASEVVTVEVRPDLAAQAKDRLIELGYDNVVCHRGDAAALDLGRFDAILVAAATRHTPAGLERQVADGGRLVIPLGSRPSQRLWVIGRRGDEFVREPHEAVAFVPLISES